MAIAGPFHENVSPAYQNGRGTELEQVLSDENAVRGIACRLLGTPNARLSKGSDLRFGSHGSLSVDTSTGQFYDHEGGSGGGILDLIARKVGGGRAEAFAWIQQEALAPRQGQQNKHAISRKRDQAAAYDYLDENGKLSFQVVRFEPKEFRQRQPGPSGEWIWNRNGTPDVPYRLPELQEALSLDKTVIIVEGEKDVDASWRLGIPATCNAGGAKKWTSHQAAYLNGADVVVVPDNDAAGRDHCDIVVSTLVGIAARLRVLSLPNLPEKGDLSEWIKAGGTADEFWRLASAAPEVQEQQLTQISNFSHFSGGATRISRGSEEPGDPLPLVREAPRADPYPVDALGPAMAAAARAFHAKTQAPMDICANAVLAVAALAGQAHADVQLPTGETKPLSLFLVTVARSGERKTSVDSLASVPVRQREADLRINNETALVEHQNAHAAWDAERKKVLNEKKFSLDERKRALDRLGPEPKPPLTPIMVCHEPTFEGLAKLLANGQPSIGIFASEGGAFIGGHGFTDEAKIRTAAGFSLLWDDGRLTRVRAGEGATALAGRRVALHLQAQPDVAARLFSDPVLADQGFLSRILVIAPDSKQGQRFWRDAQPEDEAASSSYVARLNELFRRPMPIKEGTRNELDPRPLMFTPDARALWIGFSDEIEGKLGPGHDLQAISGFAAKLPEHAARIAGVLTIFDRPDATQIGAVELACGIALSRHYAAAALRLHGASRNHVDLIDARKLLDWLQTRWTAPTVSLPDIVQLGPNATRDTTAAKRLIAILEEHRHLERLQGSATVNGKKRREVWRIVGGCHAQQ